MTGEELTERRKKLVELLGLYFDRQRMVPPVAARILSTLILNGTRGTTFDELVQELGASKATISTSLNTLLTQQRVIYFTKPGDRKRYHCTAPGYISRKIKNILELWQLEMGLHGSILEYKDAVNKTGKEEPISTFVEEDAIEFISECTQFFQRLAEKYEAREKQYTLHKL